MITAQSFLIISLFVLALIAVAFFFSRRDRAVKRLSPLASLAFGFVLAGMFFGDARLIGYPLMAIGVLIAGVDLWRTNRPV